MKTHDVEVQFHVFLHSVQVTFTRVPFTLRTGLALRQKQTLSIP